jgi:D-alanyl-lipoteichoic acid acyltransferase DltB (MBOAT superfamily)
MLLIASCIFYGAWDWRFLFLMFVSISTDYFCGIKIDESDDPKRRKLYLFISLFVSLAILGFFKYFNFFAASFETLLNSFGFKLHWRLLNIILPVGISFYTFQAMSYAFDIYRRELKPTKNYIDYALFVAYFPQLVAGPIMRARDLLPQVIHPRKVTLDGFYRGCYLIAWGLFQKVFVADNLAKIVDPVFAASAPYDGVKVLIALYAFAFQIFCDFAGYSNMARGLGACMGFDIMINFNLPYFSVNPREFWQRWHISLSTWLRDYLYIPLGGNRRGSLMTYRNLFITMLLGGLWHGANWTFVIWGAYHGFLLAAHRMLKPLFQKFSLSGKFFVGRIWFLLKVLFFFHLVCLGWLLFRATSIQQIFSMLQSLWSIVYSQEFFNNAIELGKPVLQCTWLLLLVQIFQYRKNNLEIVFKWPAVIRGLLYTMVLYYIMVLGEFNGPEFIYFQF